MSLEERAATIVFALEDKSSDKTNSPLHQENCKVALDKVNRQETSRKCPLPAFPWRSWRSWR